MYGEGISKVGEILDLATKLYIVMRSGSWFNYGDTRLGQGRDNAKEFLKANPETAQEIETKVRENADKLLKSTKTAGKKPMRAGASAAEPEKLAAAPDAPPVPAPRVNIDVETDDE